MVLKPAVNSNKPESKRVVVIDCKGHLLGRLASIVAKQALEGTTMVLVRADKVLISGSLIRNVIKFRHAYRKRTNTNPLRGPFHYSNPAMIVSKVIRGMLPIHTSPTGGSRTRGRVAFNRITVFEGIPSPYDKKLRVVIPAALRCLHLKANRKATELGELALRLGWKYKNVVDKLEEKRGSRAKVYYERKKLLNRVRKTAEELASKEKK